MVGIKLYKCYKSLTAFRLGLDTRSTGAGCCGDCDVITVERVTTTNCCTHVTVYGFDTRFWNQCTKGERFTLKYVCRI